MTNRSFRRTTFGCLLVVWAGSAGRAIGESPFPHRLWKTAAPGALGNDEKDVPKLLVHRLAGDEIRPATVIFPGGGYGGLAMGHEGQEVAEWLNDLGIAAFVLDYRHRGKGYGHPVPLQDAQRAVRMVRSKAAEWKIDRNRIGVIGFSAGGHLASTLATHFDPGRSDARDEIDRVSCRPDFVVLCYPVVALDEPYTHRGSQRNLLGDSPSPELVRSLSNEKQVTRDTPPTFLFHTDQDEAVPAENSWVMFGALRKAGVPAELHIYHAGRHGVGLARHIPGTSSWPDRCVEWLKTMEILR